MSYVMNDRIFLRSSSVTAERAFSEFYDEVLKAKFQAKPPVFFKNVNSSLKALVESNDRDPLRNEVHVSFADCATRCAYILGYGVLQSSVVADHFIEFLKKYDSVAKKLLSSKPIQMCCLGGGPVPEIVAICKVMSDMMSAAGPQARAPLEIFVTVVDECAEWETEAREIVTAVGNSKDLCGKGKIIVSFDFIQADLKNPVPEKVQETLRNSDIVTMVKFVSVVYNTLEGEESEKFTAIRDMMNNLVSHLKLGCVTFFVDNPGPGLFRALFPVMKAHPKATEIDGGSKQLTHSLHEDTKKRQAELCAAYFDTVLELPKQTIVCYITWRIHSENVNLLFSIDNPGTVIEVPNFDITTRPRARSKISRIKYTDLY